MTNVVYTPHDLSITASVLQRHIERLTRALDQEEPDFAAAEAALKAMENECISSRHIARALREAV